MEVARVVLGFVVVGGAVPGTPMQNHVSTHKPPQLGPTLGFQLWNWAKVKVPYFLTSMSQFSSLTTKWNLLHVVVIPSRIGLGVWMPVGAAVGVSVVKVAEGRAVGVPGTPTQYHVSAHIPPQVDPTAGFHCTKSSKVKVPYLATILSHRSSLTAK
jgi:hypothetical protein